MSGTASSSIVGVKRCRLPTECSTRPESGNSSELTKSSAGSPIVTTIPGCVMWSSRVSHARDRSRSSSDGSTSIFRQRLP